LLRFHASDDYSASHAHTSSHGVSARWTCRNMRNRTTGANVPLSAVSLSGRRRPHNQQGQIGRMPVPAASNGQHRLTLAVRHSQRKVVFDVGHEPQPLVVATGEGSTIEMLRLLPTEDASSPTR